MRHPFPLACGAMIALTAAGCTSFSLPFVSRSTDIVRPTATNPVMDVLTIWQPGEGRGLDNLPSRGMAGQLMFFTYREPSPALVEGNVTVYLFDDRGTEAEQSRPLWQRTFTPAEWNSFAIQTNLGTAYQLFVPYVRKGQHEAHCTVRIKFEPADGGPPVYSRMANVTLPGDRSEQQTSTLRRERIEPKRFELDAVAGTQPLAEQQFDQGTGGLRTMTLPVPGQRRISPDKAARLQQLAQAMVREQQQRSGVQQAVHATEVHPTETVSGSDIDGAQTQGAGGRYRLHR